jgi:hypothetical protein
MNEARSIVTTEEQAATIVEELICRGFTAWRRGREIICQHDRIDQRSMWLRIGDLMGRVDEAGEVRS